MVTRRKLIAAAFAASAIAMAPSYAQTESSAFNEEEVTQAAADVFGITTEATAKVVKRIFRDQGEPDGYIKGDEGSGAFVLGGRYGSGWLIRKGKSPVRVYWRGPSIGFDVGANASKCFTLVYHLKDDEDLFRRFPGVEGSVYYIGGLGVMYMRHSGVVLAPIRTGLGLRTGVNAQYQVYSHRRDWFPL